MYAKLTSYELAELANFKGYTSIDKEAIERHFDIHGEHLVKVLLHLEVIEAGLIHKAAMKALDQCKYVDTDTIKVQKGEELKQWLNQIYGRKVLK